MKINTPRSTIVIILLSFLSIPTLAQQRAISDTGEEVILHEDGTWSYADRDKEEVEIQTNRKKFTKPKKSSFLLKSKKLDIGVWLNPEIWSFTGETENGEAEYEFQLKDGDLYGMLISEKVPIPLETLKSIALENAQSVAPDIRSIKEEYRIVNGKKVLLLQMNGTTQGIKFSYYGYYYSDENGTVQLVTYTSQNLIDEYLPISEELLNGFVGVE
jgi:hypothetical protein